MMNEPSYRTSLSQYSRYRDIPSTVMTLGLLIPSPSASISIDDHLTKDTMITLHSARRTVALRAGICALALAALLGQAAPAATAQSLRDQIPIVAGTSLGVEGAHRCTAGAVLQSRTWRSLVAPVARATRYVVLAGHCASLGEEITVGGQVVGTVTWISPTHDVEIAKIPPSMISRPLCSGASQLHHCTIANPTPKAVGRIILSNGSLPEALPIRGIGVPAFGERFCTSGAVSFTNCSFELEDEVPAWGTWRPDEMAARTHNGHNVVDGDSGGPVASMGGTLYGIILIGGTHRIAGIMGYLPMDVILQDLGYQYGLAPA